MMMEQKSRRLVKLENEIASAVLQIYHRFIAYLFIAINIYEKGILRLCSADAETSSRMIEGGDVN